MWQRAKIISRKSVDRGTKGRTTWVEMGPPQLRTRIRGIYSGKLSGGDCYRTNRYLADTLGDVWIKADAFRRTLEKRKSRSSVANTTTAPPPLAAGKKEN